MNLFRPGFALSLLLLMGGCATPASRYYTLLPEARQAPAARSNSAPASYAISVQPVSVPAQVDRPQIVLGSKGSAEVTPLNNSLWAAPLSDEIRNALANDLSQRLGVIDIPARTVPKTLALWKIDFSVQRFDSIYQQGVVLDATWRLTPVNQRKRTPMICKAEVRLPASNGIPGLIQAHQAALHQLAAVIAAQIAGQTVPADTALRMKGCT
ncbi:PqiC family protein [Paralcaligenes sp. KSB-10]|jgi:uncharacterized lipoprotein YmbA|uniref:PqiC family protein n=1 Tax=Paralcaligenes sp. KSB-10 TaxID=2901142 RepID=UPI001E5836FA|nr:PqiC family protein [Paralcaligenes sp. KSB-10]UHL64507.1 PqiC family protein [Paralcaligenes sp. KSB-10]